MALLKSESPNVSIREVDLSGTLPSVTSSTGAFVGNFVWGPIDEPVLVGNEGELASTFGAPDLDDSLNSYDYLSANQFLKYSSSLFVVRAATTAALNAVVVDSENYSTATVTQTATQIANREAFDAVTFTDAFAVAKYAGELGNSISVSLCAADSVSFASWEYADRFDAAPGTSTYVSNLSADSSGAFDECHVIVLDRGGIITGQRNGVLETFPNCSLATDAKTDDGRKNYVNDVLTERSAYLYGTNIHPTIGPIGASDGAAAIDFTSATNGGGATAVADDLAVELGFKGGANSGNLTASDYTDAFAEFEDENTIQVDMLIGPGLANSSDQQTVVNDLVSIAEGRKDCVAVASPDRTSVVGQSTPTTSITAFASGLTKSSYLVLDNNYIKVYDKYNDKYEFIPAASSTAGLMANTDNVAAPWFSPAGGRRGRYLGTSSLAWNPTKSQRDTLYRADVNPIVNLPGQGIILYGDKTFLGKPSAFNRINVRRLFLIMERAIKGAAQNVLFEFNDEFSRAEFVGIIEPFLRDIQGRRGISDFRVVCDETNNTPDIIDTNQFVASVFVKPARSVNFVQLNFVAVRTGVDFEEVLGVI
jgi:phage tail sheath protein FI